MDYAVKKVLDDYELQKLYGSVEIKFVAGRVVLIKKSQTLVPEPKTRSEDYDMSR